jgi:hypothetical protein
MTGSEPFSLLNYDVMSLFTRLEPFSEMCFCPSDENYDEIMTRVKGTDLQFVGDRIQRLAIKFKGWRSAIFLTSAIFLFTGTGFLFRTSDTMQGSERIRHSILCKI